MKILFTALLSVFSFVALACPNFTGTYEGYDLEQGPYIFEIKQTGCSHISLISNGETMSVATDNVERLTISKIEQTDIGEMKLDLYVRALFVNNSLRMFQRANVTVQGQTLPPMSSDVEVYFRSPSILATVTTSMGNTETSISTKIK